MRPGTVSGNVATAANWVAPLCWIAVLLDGFDLVVVGTVVTTLQRPDEWALSGAGTTFVITIGLVGMMIGALTIGTLTDVVGRRKALIGAVAAFSFFTLLCAFAPNAAVFGLLRFLAGLGLGGCLPTAIAMVNEFTRSGRSGRATTTIMTGYHVGAVATAALAIVVIPGLGWQWMFVIGALPAVVLVPLIAQAPARVGRLPRLPRAPGRGGGGGRPVRARARGPGRPRRGARGRDRRRDDEDAVHPRVRPQHHRHRRHVVHGAAARVRAQQLAADDHA
jgi:MFS family permease